MDLILAGLAQSIIDTKWKIKNNRQFIFMFKETEELILISFFEDITLGTGNQGQIVRYTLEFIMDNMDFIGEL